MAACYIHPPMTNDMKDNKVDSKYILVTLLAVLLSWVLHELAHWLTGIALGNEMAMTLNTSFPISGKYKTNADTLMVSAAGPLFTLFQAVIVFTIMRNRSAKLLYPFLFTCLYMRLLAMGLSVIHLNDEARISRDLGIGIFTLPLIVSAFLFFLIYTISRQYGFSKKFNAINVGLVMLFSSILVLTDQALHVRIL